MLRVRKMNPMFSGGWSTAAEDGAVEEVRGRSAANLEPNSYPVAIRPAVEEYLTKHAVAG
jgi:hypothetical protein